MFFFIKRVVNINGAINVKYCVKVLCIILMKMSRIKANTVLPRELVTLSVDDLLYEIGLCLTSVRERPKRRAIDSPIVIAIVCWLYMVLRIASILIDNNEHGWLLLVGSFGHYIGLKYHFNVFLIFGILLIITSQLIYYYNYKRGIKPTFVRVFQVMSGLVTPSSVGLYRETDITRLLRYRIFFVLLHYNNCYLFPCASFLIQFLITFINESFSYLIIYIILSSIHLMYCGYIVINFITYQTLYLHIICTYLELRIKSLNNILLEMKKQNYFLKIRTILRTYDRIYREINEYNTTYWSKFLANIWIIFGMINIILIFIAIFVKINIIIRLIFIYILIVSISLFHFIFSKVCSLNHSIQRQTNHTKYFIHLLQNIT